MNNNNLIMNKELSTSDKDEIDINLIFKAFNRNKLFIGSITFLILVISCLFSISKKRVWGGQFEIVLSDQEVSRLGNLNLSPALQSLVDLPGGKSKGLETEVAILESPSVLMPIFDLVVKEKGDFNSQKSNLNFFDWKRDNLSIELKKGTSILQIMYKDVDKRLILPVLEKMSSTYQNYSGRSRRRNQELTKSFLMNQILLFKDRSRESIKKAQEFAIDQDLITGDLITNENIVNVDPKLKDDYIGSKIIIPNIGIEEARVSAANEIRRIDLQLEKIKEIGQDFDQLQYIGSTIPALVEEGLPESLKEIEEELVEMRSKYTEKDRSVVRSLEKRDLLINLLKKRAIGILEAQKLIAESRMQSAMRPKGVLIKYKELIREAGRDEATLIDLENQLRFFNLKEARSQDPWELITKPTLLKSPVAPSRKQDALIGLFIGFIFSCSLVLFKEKKSGKIYEIKELENILSVPIIEEIGIENIQENNSKVSFLIDYLNVKASNEIIFVYNGKIEKYILELFIEKLISNNLKKKVKLINYVSDFKDCNNKDSKFFVGSTKSLEYSEVEDLKKRLKLFNTYLDGIILIT